jgi:CRISPR system Cascade subunit CasC
MFVELHILQNFAPANLNRDDTGAPKDCEFGGYRRARISSQCLKRAIRRDGAFSAFLAGQGGIRTRRLITEVAKRVDRAEQPAEKTVSIVAEVFKEGGIERPQVKRGEDAEKDTTKIILFVDAPAIDVIAGHFRDTWSSLQSGDKDVRAKLVKELGEVLVRAVKAPDIALFGRMVEVDGKSPFGKLQLGVDAACQVAHAISTNKISTEFDFFTAVDELPGADAGASMMGTVEFNSACFYRYANVDLEQLKRNLGGDEAAEAAAKRTIKAFISAAVGAVPTGKQNSMAAQNPPSLVLAVVRGRGLWSLTNAFCRPVGPPRDQDLMAGSIAALDAYWAGLIKMYGSSDIVGPWVCAIEDSALTHLRPSVVDGIDAVIDGVASSLSFASPGRASAP